MPSRRFVLRSAGGVAIASVPVSYALLSHDASAATSDVADEAGAPVPETMAVHHDAIEGGRTVESSFAMTHLAVPAGATVRMRTSEGWQSWREAAGCSAGSDQAGAAPANRLMPAAGALEYQVRGREGGPLAVTELNTTDGRTRTYAASVGDLPVDDRPSGWQPPQYLSRAAWGADESYRNNPDGTLDTPPAFFPVQTITVHHSGEDLPVTDPVAHIRGIYYNQAVTMDWGDIGYQLLIDADGRIYEGTYSDDGRLPIFGPELSADGLPQMVNGSHLGSFNAGNVGICVLGNFMTAPPTAAARRSLTITLAMLTRACRLDPAGTTEYVNPLSGVTATVATIGGHQDWHTANPKAGATLCPGDHLEAALPQLREDVAALAAKFGR